MGFGLGSLLGGGSKTAAPKVWKEQSPYLTDIYKQGQGLMNQQLAPGSQFQQNLGLQTEAWKNQLQGIDNPYLTGMASHAMDQISRQFNEQIMPSLLGGGNAAGQLGGARYQQLQDSAVRTAADEMAKAGGDVYGQFANMGLLAQGNAINQGQQVLGGGWQPILAQSSVVGSPVVMGGKTSSSGGLLGGITKGLEAYAAI